MLEDEIESSIADVLVSNRGNNKTKKNI